MSGIIASLKNTISQDSKDKIAVILLGPPGAGKGTHAPNLSAHLKIPYISTGDLFRENIRNRTEIGEKAKGFIDLGQLVPDEIVLEMLFSRTAQEDCKRGVILDGFPRTVTQAEALAQKMDASYRFVVVSLEIDPELLIERISGRIACKDCGRPYHKKYAPPKKADACDSCNGPLFQRTDDTAEVLRKRLEVYQLQTEPLIEYYKKKDVLHPIQADLSKELVFENLMHVFEFEIASL